MWVVGWKLLEVGWQLASECTWQGRERSGRDHVSIFNFARNVVGAPVLTWIPPIPPSYQPPPNLLLPVPPNIPAQHVELKHVDVLRSRLLHGYRKTHRFSKTEVTWVTGTVLGFGTPFDGTPRTCTAVSRGYQRVKYSKVSVIFTVLNLVFSNLFSLFFQKVHFVTL